MVKNSSGQKIGAQMVSATDGSAFTGAVTVSVTGDAGTQAAGSVGSGACTHEGNGYHTYAPAQAETNYTLVAFTFTGTGAVPVTVQVFTTGYDPTVASLPATLSNAVTHGGSTAKLYLGAASGPALSVETAAGTAVYVESLGNDAVQLIGNNGPGLYIESTSDHAIEAIGGTNKDGIRATGNGTGVGLTATIVGNITGNLSGSIGSVATGGITAGSIAADAIGASELAADAVTEIQSGLATAANLATVASYLDTEIAAILADTNELQTDWADGGRLDLILDARASQASVDDLPTNAELATSQAAADDATLAAIAALNNLSAAQVNTEVDTALADIHLDHLLATTYDPASKPGAADALLNELVESDGGVARYTANALEQAPTGGSAPTAADIADAVWDEATAGHTTSGTFGEQVKTDVDAILADTAELQTDWVNGGRLDNILDARASQTSVDDLPTNAELATALASADDAVLAQVALVKAKTDNLPSDPADQSLLIAATDALATLIGDVPTNSELATALASADDATLAAIAALTIPTASQNAAALLDLSDGVETGLTPRQAFRLMAAALAGELSGAATATIVIRNAVADSKDRITATVDADGNRSVVTVDLT